jgi:hypothetical protein
MMTAASASETLLNFYQTLWCNNSENSHLYTCCHENLKSLLLVQFSDNILISWHDILSYLEQVSVS